MFYLIHILAGAVIAKYFPSLWPVIILSLLSHFIIDIIPHKDTPSSISKSFKKSYSKFKLTKTAVFSELSDIIPSLILIFYLFLKFNSLLMLISVFFSLLPDIVKVFYFTPVKNNKIFKGYMDFHNNIQTELSWFWGIITQIIVAIILVLLLI
jgi:hypothetical protein